MTKTLENTTEKNPCCDFGVELSISTPHPSVVWYIAVPPASPSEPLSSIFSSAGLNIHCGSTAFRCCLALLVRATDRQANILNWMCAASLASRGDPDSSLQISALSHLLHSLTHRQNVQPLAFKLCPSVFHLVFISCPPSASSLSLIPKLCVTAHSTAHTPAQNMAVQQRLNL